MIEEKQDKPDQTIKFDPETTFGELHEKFFELCRQLPSRDGEHGGEKIWDDDSRKEASRIVKRAVEILDQVDSSLAKSYLTEITNIQESCFHRSTLSFGVKTAYRHEMESREGKTDWTRELNAAAEEYRNLLRKMCGELGHVKFQDMHPDSMDAQKLHIAYRLGKKNLDSLNTFVSSWKSTQEQDLPWVIRKPGVSWIPNMNRFEEWLKTSEGGKLEKKAKKKAAAKTTKAKETKKKK